MKYQTISLLIGFWCERRDVLCSYSKGHIFTCEDNMLFSHVKISSFRAKAYLVFHWCLYRLITAEVEVLKVMPFLPYTLGYFNHM